LCVHLSELADFMELTFPKVTLFPLGGFLIITKDFDGPDVESEELRERIRIRRKQLAEAVFSLRHLPRNRRHSEKPCDVEAIKNCQDKVTMSRHETESSMTGTEWTTSTVTSPTSTLAPGDLVHAALAEHTPPKANDYSSRHLQSRTKRFMGELLKPMPIVVVFSILISLVDPLKALFLPPSPTFHPHFRPIAPDGKPPLAFILDSATFIGGASVPIGLICLGSALAHLRVGSGTIFPRGAIAALALAKMAVTPILGVGLTRLFVHAGFIHRDDKVLQFVCMCVRPRLCTISFLL
jgi:auxin efflux carrier family protein